MLAFCINLLRYTVHKNSNTIVDNRNMPRIAPEQSVVAITSFLLQTCFIRTLAEANFVYWGKTLGHSLAQKDIRQYSTSLALLWVLNTLFILVSLRSFSLINFPEHITQASYCLIKDFATFNFPQVLVFNHKIKGAMTPQNRHFFTVLKASK